MSYGHKVRYLRKKKQMKQEDLSRGICSVSYLSKIENEILQPSDETIELLLNRLGYIEDANALTEIQGRLYQWNNTFMTRDVEESDRLYHYFEGNDFSNESIQLDYKVLRIRYDLQHDKIAHVKKELVDLTEKTIDMSLKTRFYFYKHSAYYFYHVGKFDEAVKQIFESQKFIAFLDLSSIELADFYYTFSFMNSKNDNTKTAVKYAEMALSHFQAIYMLHKCVDCHILLGICHKRNFYYDLAQEHYDTALSLAVKIHYHEMVPPIKHNLGSLYSIAGKDEQALGLFKELYEKQSDFQSYNSARIVLSLVKEYCKAGRMNEAAQCLDKCYRFVQKDPSLLSLRAEYIFYHLLLGGEYKKLDREMEKVIIPELTKQNKYLTLSSFCDYLGDYYVAKSGYKKSSYYFQLGKEYIKMSLQNHLGMKV
ncbi:helix-turn-helix transcriptional regulator [Rossellomorea sp. YZS02]|uniref:helix-turn-helix domain-containing protein n=1 Tax=Rossellomorea sp. YZS02 TaxID=3097358 RepID=UPI002A14EE5C|nr:helix-turn-helix transcriptional regulator [Rossellomorea sp. YZS02]MDX8346146.1 helix-turn-helix transcriptional regulator [Rossellomorea sp. YZS02]